MTNQTKERAQDLMARLRYVAVPITPFDRLDLLAIFDDYAERIDTNETKAGASVESGPCKPTTEGSTPSPDSTDADEITAEQMLEALDEIDRDLANWPDPLGWLAEKRKRLKAIRSRLAAPRVSVTRGWVEEWAKAVWNGGSCIHGNIYAILRELGVSVEGGEEGK